MDGAGSAMGLGGWSWIQVEREGVALYGLKKGHCTAPYLVSRKRSPVRGNKGSADWNAGALRNREEEDAPGSTWPGRCDAGPTPKPKEPKTRLRTDCIASTRARDGGNGEWARWAPACFIAVSQRSSRPVLGCTAAALTSPQPAHSLRLCPPKKNTGPSGDFFGCAGALFGIERTQLGPHCCGLPRSHPS
jgi:hypothetical protein